MCNKNDDTTCIAEILTVILVLQRNASCGEYCLDSCDRGFLGCGSTSLSCNTRPVTLYGCSQTPWKFPVSKDVNETTVSSIFRIEKLDNNCATFRVLVENPDAADTNMPFIATNSFFTIDLNCVCALRCLNDVYIECI